MRRLGAETLVSLIASVCLAVMVAAGGTALARMPSIADTLEAAHPDPLIRCAIAPGDMGCVPQEVEGMIAASQPYSKPMS